jgi:hypothetical protein
LRITQGLATAPTSEGCEISYHPHDLSDQIVTWVTLGGSPETPMWLTELVYPPEMVSYRGLQICELLVRLL